MCAEYGMSKRGPPSIPCQNACDGAVQTIHCANESPSYPEKPCRAMCDTVDDLSSIPDASLLISEPEDQSPECLSEIAHHEHLPASRGHDPPAVHHGAAAEDPCNTIMQRYLPLRLPSIMDKGACITLRDRGFSLCRASAVMTSITWLC